MPDDLLAPLNAAQRDAVETVRGPVCILAGAGSGKTRTITHRIAYQVRTGVARPGEILAVTFTDRAASELRARLGQLGLEQPVRAATFHAAAWAQLRYFWSRGFGDRPLPEVLPSKLTLLVPTARRLRVEGRDLAAEIEWAKARRIGPDAYVREGASRQAPLPVDDMAEVYRRYEEDKRARGLVDYDDMLSLTTELLTADADAATEVRDRYRHFTVDEFQDVNPAQWALLETWLGERDDLCVVGDDDQTIYSFTGATSTYLTGFSRRFPHARVVSLVDNYRSTAEVLELANEVLAPNRGGPAKRLRAQRRGGPAPVLRPCDDEEAERDAVIAGIRALLAAGTPAGEIAVAYRINSQSEPFEAALTDAEIPFAVRGDEGFFARPEIVQALGLLRAAVGRPPPPGPPPPSGAQPAHPPKADREVERVLRQGLSWHPKREPPGQAARDRWRNVGALLEAAQRMVRHDPEVTFEGVVADLERRAREGEVTPEPGGAVALLTLHKAKGLEFDAVFVVACEEGLLPIVHAKTDDEVAEERRLLYVGVTRAREHLHVSWAARRTGRGGRATRRRRSRFLDQVAPSAPTRPVDEGLAGQLRQWRRQRARLDGVPAYVVFPDSTLAELSRRRPTSHQELSRVPGLGPTRLERYGQELLSVLAQ